MLITSTDDIPGRNITEVRGMVRGSTVRARNIGRDITAGFRNLVGGELPEYTNLLDESRALAIERMVEQAESLGANAIVGTRLGGLVGHGFVGAGLSHQDAVHAVEPGLLQFGVADSSALCFYLSLELFALRFHLSPKFFNLICKFFALCFYLSPEFFAQVVYLGFESAALGVYLPDEHGGRGEYAY